VIVPRSGSFDYIIEAPCSPATAVALLGDLRRQGELHPLIVEVKQLPARAGAIESYAITDRLKVGPITFRIVYDADVVERTASVISTVARQRPGTVVHNQTTVSQTDDGVRVTVKIELTAPTLLFRYAISTAETAHRELGRRIAARLAELAT